jgi:hypothetical protein
MERNTQTVADLLRIGQILPRSAIFGAIILVPVLHKKAADFIASLKETERRHGGVDPS